MRLFQDEDFQRAVLGGVVAMLLALGLAAAIPGAQGAETKTLLNVSYDPTRELYREINRAFAAAWKSKTGGTATINDANGVHSFTCSTACPSTASGVWVASWQQA